MRRLVVPLVLLVFVQCGGTTRTPQAALRTYAQALRARDAESAYRLMSNSFRNEYTLAEFKEMMANNPAETRSVSTMLAEESNARVVVHAGFDYGLGERLELVKEEGVWRVAHNPLEFYSQATPQQCVRSFVRAYLLKRWDVMLRLAPKAYSERMTEDLVRLQFDGPTAGDMKETMERLRLSVGAPIAVIQNGNETHVRYADDLEVVLTREDELWKIKEL